MKRTLAWSVAVWWCSMLLLCGSAWAAPKAKPAVADTAASGAAAAAAKIDPMDWYRYRGPEQNGFSREVGLIEEWDPRSGKNVLWMNEEAATRSTPIVMNGKLYVLCRDQPETPREGEKVICLDAATGKKLWENRWNVWLSDVPDTRVAWANVVGDPETGRVYALGVCGYFVCLDGETGKTLWSRTLHEEFGLLSTYGGRTYTPIVFEDLVLISAVTINWGDLARPAHRFMAFDKRTGECRWFNGTTPLPDDTTYSTPFLTVIDDQAAMVFGSGDGHVWAFQPRTGQPIWKYELSLRGLNVAPIVVDGVVYTNQAEENTDAVTMGAVVAIKASGKGDITKTNTLWQVKEVTAGRAQPVYLNGRLYVLDDKASIWTFDAKTGEELDRQKLAGSVVFSNPLYADGKIYACTTGGWNVLKVNEDGTLKALVKMRLPRDDEVLGSPIVSHGRIYLPTARALYCLGNPDAQPKLGSPIPSVPQEPAVAEDPQPVHLQLVPAESLIAPGEKITFRARLYNARGQFLRETEAKFSVDNQSAASIDASGQFTAVASKAHSAVMVTAQAGELTSQARVRIVPPLPWRFDFEDLSDAPLTWIGARYRHRLVELDGGKVLLKRNDIPKGTRSRAWMGPSHLHDYTIQADVRGEEVNGQLPDIGLVAQGYTFALMGNHQQLSIRLWDPQDLRLSKSLPFSWKADTWYTMKFRASLEGDKAVLRGKVWPRGQQEPAEWTIEVADEQPMLSGSPGLYGDAKVCQFYLDNISVTPNAK